MQHRDGAAFCVRTRAAGLEFHGAQAQAEYLATFREPAIVGVVAHSWFGGLIVEVPVTPAELARAGVATSERRVTGFSGPLGRACWIWSVEALSTERKALLVRDAEG